MVVLFAYRTYRTRICTEVNDSHTKNRWTQVDNQEMIKLGNKVKNTQSGWRRMLYTDAMVRCCTINGKVLYIFSFKPI